MARNLRLLFYQYVDNNFEFKTHLLSLKDFCPSFRLRTSLGLSKALKLWAISVFRDFRIREEHILGSVTDKEMAKNCIGSFWEWCIWRTSGECT
jgi:hypothetical protein